jgi:hypothetical protein
MGTVARWPNYLPNNSKQTPPQKKFFGQQKLVAGKRPKVAEKRLNNLSYQLTWETPLFMQF